MFFFLSFSELFQLQEIAKTIRSSPQHMAEFYNYLKSYNDVLKSDKDAADKAEVPDILPILDVPTCCRQENGPICEPPTETELATRACLYHHPEICYEFDMQKPRILL